MTRKHFSAFTLLVFAMFAFVSCDDDTTTERTPTAPLSDFEWSIMWHDVRPISRPMFGNETITTPALGAFDVVKVDTGGTELWRQSFAERHFCTSKNYGSGYIAAGVDGDNNTIVRYISSNGEPQWRTVLDSLWWVSAVAHAQPNTVFVFGGKVVNDHPAVALARVSTSGSFEGYEVFTESDIRRDNIVGAITTSDNGVLAFGYTFPEGATEDKASLVVRLNPDGSRRWWNVFALSEWDAFQDAVELSGGDFLLVGETQPDGRYSRALLMRLSAEGNEVWNHTTSIGSGWDIGFGVVKTDTSVIIAGNSLADGGLGTYCWLAQYSLSGVSLGTRLFENSRLHSAAPPISLDQNGEVFLYLNSDINGGSNFSLAKPRQPIFPDL